MGYSFTIKGGFKVKVEGNYPWPWSGDPNRTIRLYKDDILTKSTNGTYTKQTGLGCINILLKDEEVIPLEEDVSLRML